MTAIFFEGIVFGLILAIMLGPIFVALTQTAIEKGARAGITVGAGIWTSDLLVILFSYLFISEVDKLVQDHVFKYWMAVVGGLVLITFGIAIFINKTEEIASGDTFTAKNYIGFWLKGFLVNTINPFTFIFWLTVISAKVIGFQMSAKESAVFLSSILLVIIITDILKVFLAKAIRNILMPKHIQWISRIAGIALVVSGILLLYKSNDPSSIY